MMRGISDLTKCNYTIIRIPHKTYYGRFRLKQNSALKFRKFHVPNGTVHSECTDPTRATARLVIVLVSRKGTFRSDLQRWSPIFRRTEPKYSRLSLNGYLYMTDTSVKGTPRVGPCLSLLPLFDSL